MSGDGKKEFQWHVIDKIGKTHLGRELRCGVGSEGKSVKSGLKVGA